MMITKDKIDLESCSAFSSVSKFGVKPKILFVALVNVIEQNFPTTVTVSEIRNKNVYLN